MSVSYLAMARSIENRKTKERLMEDVSSDASDNRKKDTTHFLVNLLDCDLEDELCLPLMQIFQ